MAFKTEFTPEELERLRKDPLMQFLCNMGGVDLDALIEAEKKRIAPEKPKPEKRPNDIGEIIKRLQAERERAEREHKKAEQKKPYEAPKAKEIKPRFIMSAEQLEQFCKDYSELIANVKKLNYLFGINVADGNSTFNFSDKIQKIIWDLIEIIFGSDNRDDIADFIFGNSNFDTVEDLYEELT